MKFFRLGLFLFVFFSVAFSASAEETIRRVARVVDANVLILDNGQAVRLIGVNAPSPYDTFDGYLPEEKEHFVEIAHQAKEFVKYLVEGKSIRLELDSRNEFPHAHRDEKGQILSYVWFTTPVYSQVPNWLVFDPRREKGTHDAFLNAIILRAGYARMDTNWPFSYAGKFLSLQTEAKEERRGMWKSVHILSEEEIQEREENAERIQAGEPPIKSDEELRKERKAKIDELATRLVNRRKKDE